MIWTCIDYQLDFVAFVACCLVGLFVLGRLVERCQREHTAYLVSAVMTAVFLVAGNGYVHKVDATQRCNLINHMSAFATTYAGETEKLNHATLSNNVSSDDPDYLKVVDAQRRWLEANALVSDIYTIRRTAEGGTILVVDSETDYDHSGTIDQDREQRTDPGEAYEGFSSGEQAQALNNALAGVPAFIANPYRDRWGLWVSALHPIRDAQGRVEAVLGVDFPASVWGQQIFNARLSVLGILAVIESLLLTGAAIVTLTRFHLKQQRFAADRLQQFKTTLDQTLDSVFMFRPTDFRFIYVNEGARQLLGYSEEQYLGMTPLNIVPGMSLNDLHELIQPLIEGTHQLFTFETTHRHINGKDIPVELSLQFVSQATDTPRFVGIVRDITERKEIEHELMMAARLDRLTGLPNRALFNDRLKLYIERTQQIPGYKFALMFLDFDRFKIVNDSLGHEVGDALLKEIASRLKGNLCTTDSISTLADGTTVSRLGGDEFVVIVDDIAGPETACQTANRLIAALGEQYRLGDHEVRSTASIGIVCSHPGYVHAEDMIRDADTAMYEAKARGNGCYVIFDDSMREASRQRVQTESDLRAAIGADELKLAWQPIVSLETGELHGAEALVRWNHPTRGTLLPREFLAIAEETRLILPISEWILREACRQYVEWQRNAPHLAPQYISINLSERQLMQNDLIPLLTRVIREFSMRPDQLQVELTEAKIISHRENAGTAIHSLAQAGIRLAIDDFGTGYSSLACLQQYPFSSVKLDRSFLSQPQTSQDMLAVAGSIITLAETLRITCIAEGIEDKVQLTILRTMKCRLGQGNFICPAGPAEQILLAPWKESLAVKTLNSKSDSDTDSETSPDTAVLVTA
jgi:diguanylate cyclase (GGDEF)-like protein/PAS domain S-box-containing protein